MHTPITRQEAVALYKQATVCLAYDGIDARVTTFEANGQYVQVNTFDNRVEYFTQPRTNLVDEVFVMNYEDEENSVVILGEV